MFLTSNPPPLGSVLPRSSEIPFRCASYSSSDIQSHDFTVYSTNGHLHSHFFQLSCTVCDCVRESTQESLLELHVSLSVWITCPYHPLHLPDILHDIFLKTGNAHDDTHGLLCRNLTDKTNSTSRYPHHITVSIFAQCTYLLNRIVRPPSTRSPIFSFHVST